MKFPEGLKLIADTLWQIKDKEDFGNVLEDILTAGEITEIADRILIVKYLKEGIGQREIAQKLLKQNLSIEAIAEATDLPPGNCLAN